MTVLVVIDCKSQAVERWVSLGGERRMTHQAETFKRKRVKLHHVRTMQWAPPAAFKLLPAAVAS